MIVSLYTTRIVLKTLGIVDYGIYNIVGTIVATLGIVTNALSSSISRYLTYELGRGDIKRLNSVFSISIKLLLLISVIVLILGETVGLWFINNAIDIPANRDVAANWVWQSTIVIFIINLLSVPYNSLIIAHEHMNAYAIISILEVTLKLLLVLLLQYIVGDKLIIYSILLVITSIFIRLAYGIYCKKHFSECSITFNNDKSLLKEIFAFTGYSFYNQVPYVLNTQGINILINIFYGVTFNAARGIAYQVEAAIILFVSNFMVAIKPQITKSYAVNNKERMFSLICSGSKFGYFLLMIIALPIIIETDYILEFWLGEYPNDTVAFIRLSIIGYMVSMLGETGYTACQATGDIKKYTYYVTTTALIPLPATYLAYSLGGSINYAYYTFIFTYILVNIVRLVLMKQMLGFRPTLFVKTVVIKITIVTVLSIIAPLCVWYIFKQGLLRLIILTLVSLVSTILTIWLYGLTKDERHVVSKIIKQKLKIA